MSEVVTRILRAAGETGRPVVHAVVLIQDHGGAALVVERLSAMGCRAVPAADEAAAAKLLTEEAEINALVVEGRRHDELDALVARLCAGRTEQLPLAVINLASGSPVNEAVHAAASTHLVQTVTLQDLPLALNTIDKSLALATGEVQRQVEIIARAVIKLGQRLHRITNQVEPVEALSGTSLEIADQVKPAIDNAEVVATLRSLIHSRRLRDRFFQDARFGEPAWDILLDLALAWYENKSVSASSVCIASGVPMSTAMRWINEMVEANLIERWIDPTDGRRNLVQIAPATRNAMLRYISALKQASSLPASPEK